MRAIVFRRNNNARYSPAVSRTGAPNITSSIGFNTIAIPGADPKQIDPKDIDILEAQRGSYAADYGDRTYGIFNVEPRTGFEKNNEAELIVSAGNFYQTDDQLNFGATRAGSLITRV
jgi:hypothetical protein